MRFRFSGFFFCMFLTFVLVFVFVFIHWNLRLRSLLHCIWVYILQPEKKENENDVYLVVASTKLLEGVLQSCL